MGERTMDPKPVILPSVVPASAGDARFPYQAKPRIHSAWHLSQVPRIQVGGKVPIRANACQFAATDKAIMHLPGAIPHLAICQPHC